MLKSCSSLPPNPWNYVPPHSDITIRFSDYGPRISHIDAAYCLLDAANIVIMHWGDQGPIGATALITMSGNVDLHLITTNEVTWYQWGTAIRGITDFVAMYDAVHMDFSILDAQEHVIAGGILSLAS